MLQHLWASGTTRIRERFRSLSERRGKPLSLGARLAHFWFVWSLLLFIHEGGHAWCLRLQGHSVESITVGAGPALWQGAVEGARIDFRLVPLLGITRTARPPAREFTEDSRSKWDIWRDSALTLSAGAIATTAFAIVVAAFTGLWERARRKRTIWGRMIVADAIVLTVFNFLPVPPLDGGRALLGTIATWRGTPLSGDALFWVQVSGLALAIIPMTLWTRWTSRIDRVTFSWRAPRQ